MYAQEGDSQRCGRRSFVRLLWSLDRDALDLGFGIGIDKEFGLAFAKYGDDNLTERWIDD